MRALLVLLSAVLIGCGYPADPLPPALNRPVGVRDLTAVERGSKIVVSFTMPAETTEGLPLKGVSEIELRAGAIGDPFNPAQWEAASDRIDGREFDAAKFYDKTIVIAVRVKGPKGQNTGWSNYFVMTVVPALPLPEGLEVANALNAVRLEWHGASPQYRVFRRAAGQKDFTEIGLATQPSYVDQTISYGAEYEYRVQAIEKTGDSFAESEVSQTKLFRPVDQFAPAIPIGLTAVAATRSIELLWERNIETDLAGYRVYRDGVLIADVVASPTYSDKDVKPGTKYLWKVTSVDTSGNESAPSAAVEAVIP